MVSKIEIKTKDTSHETVSPLGNNPGWLACFRGDEMRWATPVWDVGPVYLNEDGSSSVTVKNFYLKTNARPNDIVSTLTEAARAWDRARVEHEERKAEAQRRYSDE